MCINELDTLYYSYIPEEQQVKARFIKREGTLPVERQTGEPELGMIFGSREEGDQSVLSCP
jgi:hypothetical protein